MSAPAYETAMRELTPLQTRVLAALDHEPQDVKLIAEAATLHKYAICFGKFTRRGLDIATTRNVLGWLAVKGLAARDPDGRWRRTGDVVAIEDRLPSRARPRGTSRRAHIPWASVAA